MVLLLVKKREVVGCRMARLRLSQTNDDVREWGGISEQIRLCFVLFLEGGVLSEPSETDPGSAWVGVSLGIGKKRLSIFHSIQPSFRFLPDCSALLLPRFLFILGVL